jgi:Bacterial PH domain
MAGRFYRIGSRGAKSAQVECARPVDYPAPQETSMSYVQRVLQPGETVRHTSNVHWVVYWPGAGVLLLALAAIIAAQFATDARLSGFYIFVAITLAVIGACLLFWRWFTWWTTEIAVTSRRVIYKEGFIRRDTNEMNLDKVESVRVKQSILGRILNYGHVIIIGTGEGETELRSIGNPLQLRNYITGVTT